MRKELTDLIEEKIMMIARNKDDPTYVDFINPDGLLLFSVQATDLFDANGNHFEDDIG